MEQKPEQIIRSPYLITENLSSEFRLAKQHREMVPKNATAARLYESNAAGDTLRMMNALQPLSATKKSGSDTKMSKEAVTIPLFNTGRMALPKLYDPTESPLMFGIPHNILDYEELQKIRNWCRFFFRTHHIVPTLIDIFARFPAVGMTNNCKDPAIKRFYDDMFLDSLDYENFIVQVGTEHWKIGECCQKGTKILMADGTNKNIEDVELGDFVLTHKGNKKQVTERFANKNPKIYDINTEGQFEKLSVTGNHPVFAVKRNNIMCEVHTKQQCWPDVLCSDIQTFVKKDGTKSTCHSKNGCKKEWNFDWILAQNLEVGDYVFRPVDNCVNKKFSSEISPGGILLKITSIAKRKFDDFVYNIEVEDDHSYVANNIAVHNCICLGEWSETIGGWVSDDIMNPDDVEIKLLSVLKENKYFWHIPSYLKNAMEESPEEKAYLMQNMPALWNAIKNDVSVEMPEELVGYISNKANPWDVRGTPILMRAFKHLMREEKLMRAQMAVAERLYTPLILATLGLDASQTGGQRAWIPGQGDIATVHNLLEVALSSDLRLITHHFGLKIENVFGQESLPGIKQDLKDIEVAIMKVFGIGEDLISSGRGNTYAASALNAEFAMQRLRTYSHALKRFIHKDRYEAVAEAQGFYDYEKKGDLRIPIEERVLIIDSATGEERIETRKKLLYPEVEFQTVDLRTEKAQREFINQLKDSGIIISDRRSLIGVDIDLDKERETKQQEELDKAVWTAESRKQIFEKLTELGVMKWLTKSEREAILGDIDIEMGDIQPIAPQDMGNKPLIGDDLPIGKPQLPAGIPERGEQPDNNISTRPEQSDEQRTDMPKPAAASKRHKGMLPDYLVAGVKKAVGRKQKMEQED
jgi:hypothetical protein